MPEFVQPVIEIVVAAKFRMALVYILNKVGIKLLPRIQLHSKAKIFFQKQGIVFNILITAQM